MIDTVARAPVPPHLPLPSHSPSSDSPSVKGTVDACRSRMLSELGALVGGMRRSGDEANGAAMALHVCRQHWGRLESELTAAVGVQEHALSAEGADMRQWLREIDGLTDSISHILFSRPSRKGVGASAEAVCADGEAANAGGKSLQMVVASVRALKDRAEALQRELFSVSHTAAFGPSPGTWLDDDNNNSSTNKTCADAAWSPTDLSLETMVRLAEEKQLRAAQHVLSRRLEGREAAGPNGSLDVEEAIKAMSQGLQVQLSRVRKELETERQQSAAAAKIHGEALRRAEARHESITTELKRRHALSVEQYEAAIAAQQQASAANTGQLWENIMIEYASLLSAYRGSELTRASAMEALKEVLLAERARVEGIYAMPDADMASEDVVEQEGRRRQEAHQRAVTEREAALSAAIARSSPAEEEGLVAKAPSDDPHSVWTPQSANHSSVLSNIIRGRQAELNLALAGHRAALHVTGMEWETALHGVIAKYEAALARLREVSPQSSLEEARAEAAVLAADLEETRARYASVLGELAESREEVDTLRAQLKAAQQALAIASSPVIASAPATPSVATDSHGSALALDTPVRRACADAYSQTEQAFHVLSHSAGFPAAANKYAAAAAFDTSSANPEVNATLAKKWSGAFTRGFCTCGLPYPSELLSGVGQTVACPEADGAFSLPATSSGAASDAKGVGSFVQQDSLARASVASLGKGDISVSEGPLHAMLSVAADRREASRAAEGAHCPLDGRADDAACGAAVPFATGTIDACVEGQRAGMGEPERVGNTVCLDGLVEVPSDDGACGTARSPGTGRCFREDASGDASNTVAVPSRGRIGSLDLSRETADVCPENNGQLKHIEIERDVGVEVADAESASPSYGAQQVAASHGVRGKMESGISPPPIAVGGVSKAVLPVVTGGASAQGPDTLLLAADGRPATTASDAALSSGNSSLQRYEDFFPRLLGEEHFFTFLCRSAVMLSYYGTGTGATGSGRVHDTFVRSVRPFAPRHCVEGALRMPIRPVTMVEATAMMHSCMLLSAEEMSSRRSEARCAGGIRELEAALEGLRRTCRVQGVPVSLHDVPLPRLEAYVASPSADASIRPVAMGPIFNALVPIVALWHSLRLQGGAQDGGVGRSLPAVLHPAPPSRSMITVSNRSAGALMGDRPGSARYIHHFVAAQNIRDQSVAGASPISSPRIR